MKNIISADEKYYLYLKKRSLIGCIYRRYFLYPRICKGLHDRLLDFGCGIGDFLRYHKNAIGVDINQHNIEYCKMQGLDAKLLQNDRIPFPDKHFTSIVMDNVIEHIPQEEVPSVLHEIIRVMKPGGTLLIGVPGIKGYASDDDHKHFYTENELVNQISQFGCWKKKTMHMPFYFPVLEKYLSQYCIYIYFERNDTN